MRGCQFWSRSPWEPQPYLYYYFCHGPFPWKGRGQHAAIKPGVVATGGKGCGPFQCSDMIFGIFDIEPYISNSFCFNEWDDPYPSGIAIAIFLIHIFQSKLFIEEFLNIQKQFARLRTKP